MSFSDDELDRYARHIVLPQVGGVGQQRLKAANVAVIGAGGIGAAVIPALAGAGVGKLIIITSHGGNVPMIDIVSRELRVRHEMLAVATGWSRFGHPDGTSGPEENLYGIHGGEVETSLMLHLRPDLVHMDKAGDFRSTQLDFIKAFKHLRAHGPVQFGWKAQDLNPEGAVGNAAAATAEKGKRVVDFQAKAFVELCRDVDDFDLGRLWSP